MDVLWAVNDNLRLRFSSTVQPINKNNDHSKNGTAPNGMPLPAVVVTSEVDPNGPVDKV